MEPEGDQHQPEDAWESLPIDFLIKILRDHNLPISTLLECRSVCKKWKEVIDGHELRNKIWKNSIIMFHARRENTAHFCCRNRWITRNLRFVPKKLVAADGGLLCFGERISTAYVMYNPVSDKILFLNVPLEINGEHTVIDGMLKCKVVGLVVDQSTKNFKLVLGGVQVGTDRRRTLIYDSTNGTWMKVLLIFDLEEGTWNALVEESMEATPIGLQMAAYERHLCLLASDWINWPFEVEFDRWINVTNFLRNPMVRRMDEALFRRVKNLYNRALFRRRRFPWNMDEAIDEAVTRRFLDHWDLDYPTVFNFYATGGSDAFFVFDEERIELEVVKYCAELDWIIFLPQPPFHSRNRVQHFVYAPSPDDPWCAIIPSPRGSARQGWIRQQEYVAQQERHRQEETREAVRQYIRDALRQAFGQSG
ncbi:hypothetical protein AXG93_2053s1000 [Marchantia polymorpha subsp. ruderalis]|uniref:F-box domain-containing protein n=1 Tax=Marchantia polymorpha subsp. ruderalis TaxID=1480154 RepID=A0A176VR05_MARPO|nr:hypothetical protein AXG93_2053s1000 [Marchantia polymorpha subsp. ruderalis]